MFPAQLAGEVEAADVQIRRRRAAAVAPRRVDSSRKPKADGGQDKVRRAAAGREDTRKHRVPQRGGGD